MNQPQIQMWPIDRLQPYPQNNKNHPPEQVAKIAASIKKYGWTQAFTVDKNGVIINGHGRRLAALQLGVKEVPVIVRDDLSEQEVRAARLADNRVADSTYDTEAIRAELADIQIDMSDIFDVKELTFLTEDLSIINAGVFVEDLDTELDKQKEATQEKIKEVATRKVPIGNVLGFKHVTGSDERVIATFMSQAEAETGLEGAEAFLAVLHHWVNQDAGLLR